MLENAIRLFKGKRRFEEIAPTCYQPFCWFVLAYDSHTFNEARRKLYRRFRGTISRLTSAEQLNGHHHHFGVIILGDMDVKMPLELREALTSKCQDADEAGYPIIYIHFDNL